MIKYIKRKDLEVEKYDACIQNSLQSNVFAFSWYLDIVADNWDVLVLNDYEVVMPIPWNKKSFLKYTLQPFFCQQLGFYSKREIKKEVLYLFFKKIPLNILYLNLSVNKSIETRVLKFETKTNYVLDLNDKYDYLANNYRKDRRKSLKKAFKAELSFKSSKDKNTLINLYKKVFLHLSHSDKYFDTIDKIIDFCLKQKKGFIREIYHNEELVCSGFFILFNNRIYYIFSASSNEGKRYGATTFLINSVIKEFAESNYIFDFEGSNIKNVASFYKSFGSKTSSYFNFTSNAFKRISF